MGRKVFISVLGTGRYEACAYARENFVSTKTRFIQQATMEYIGVADWTMNDHVYILLTQAARDINWVDKKLEDKEEIIGLKSVIEAMSLSAPCTDVAINDGKDEQEIWQIFQQLNDIIQEGDELYIDLTHGFRYLPMLVLVFGNYAKFLKKVCIRHLSYGNFEYKRQYELDTAPIVDLLPFTLLQDWTFATGDFLKNGDAKRLQKLCKDELSVMFQKKPEGELRVFLKDFREFVDLLSYQTESMKLCRGLNIADSKSWGRLQELGEKVKGNMIPPMEPVIEKIQRSVSEFIPTEDVRNGYHAFLWSYEHQLYQQAITILLETWISQITQIVGLDWKDKEVRNHVASAIHLLLSERENNRKEESNTKEYSCDEEVKTIANKLRSNALFQKISKMYTNVNNTRNDINHYGINSNPITNPVRFDHIIKGYVDFVKELIK